MFKAQNFLVRNTISPRLDLREFSDYKVVMEQINSNPEFLEQLLIANPNLYVMLERYFAKDLSKKKEKQLLKTVYKYYKRSFFRATPFGLFSETSIGKFATQPNYILNNKTHKNILFDKSWIIKLVHKIEHEFSEQLFFKVNNANYIFGDRVHQIYTINSSDLEEINIKLTEAYRIVDKLCEDSFVEYKQIVNVLVEQYGLRFKDQICQYIDGLIDNHYLISNLQVDIINDFSLENLINKLSELPNASKYINKLRKIDGLIREYQILEIGEGIKKIKEIYLEMSLLIPSDNYLQVDLYNKSEICLDFDIKEKAEKLAVFFNNVMSTKKRTHLIEYMDKFIEKYGINQEVQLIEMMDSSFGIGAPYRYSHPQNDFIEASPNISSVTDEEEKMYMKMYEEALATNGYINLEELNTYYYKNYVSTDLNMGLELFFHLYSNNGKVNLLLGNTVGTNNLGGASGRFSKLSLELAKYHADIVSNIECKNHSDKVTSCEIVFLPENIRHANVMGNKINRDKVLPIFTNINKESIKLKNIYIGVSSNGNFYAKDISTGEILRFYITNMYNKMLFSNEIRFLYEISTGGYFENLPWDICFKNNCYTPRVVFDEIVVSPAKWKFFLENVSGSDDSSLEDFLKKNKVPDKFYVVNGDNKMYISMENALDFKLLKDIFSKKKLVELQEYLHDDTTLIKENKFRVSEVVIPFINDSGTENKYIRTVNSRRIQIDKREKFPFNEWLYLKLYIPTRRQEEFLTDYLGIIQSKVANNNGELFFLRYIDSKPHIRLRIKSDKTYQIYKSIVGVLTECQKNRVISSFDISIYDREIERYGGEKLIGRVEKLFCLDSYLVIEILSKVKCGDFKLSVDDMAIITVYSYLKCFFNGNNRLILNFLNEVSPKQIKNNINKVIKHYQSIVKSEFIEKNISVSIPNFNNVRHNIKNMVNKAEGSLNHAIVDSIIHVHNNRLIGIDREKEKLIYFVIKKLIITEEYKKGMN